jgi:multidrug efflux pump
VPSELAPPEDRGSFFVMLQGPEGAGYDYTVEQVQKVEEIMLREVGEGKPLQRVNSRVPGGFGASEEMHTGMVIVFLQDWDKRDVSTTQVVETLRTDLAQLPAVRALPQVRSGLTRSRGQPFNVVLGGPDYAELVQWRDRVLARMEQNPGLFGADSDYKETRPQVRVQIDRARAADLGVSVADIGRTLETMMGSRRVTTYVEDGRGVRRDPAGPGRRPRRALGPAKPLRARALGRSGAAGESGHAERTGRARLAQPLQPPARDHDFGRARTWLHPGRSAAVDAADRRGRTAGVRADRLQGRVARIPAVRQRGAVHLRHGPAVVYLVLAAQFESFVHPLVIMLTVPLAVLGALIGLWLTGGSLNLFSQIGIVMLVGLAAKNGILIVEFANQLRDEGWSVDQAIVESAAVRLRPILMTSIATIMGAVPLVVAGGPGSASRATIGVVVIFGVAFSTLLSLYVVPAFYRLLAPHTRSPDALARALDKLEAETPIARDDHAPVRP